jgi:hypothetical protein
MSGNASAAVPTAVVFKKSRRVREFKGVLFMVCGGGVAAVGKPPP